MTSQIKTDISAYIIASRVYMEMCDACEIDREYAIQCRNDRRALMAIKIEKAENLLMSIQGEYAQSLKQIGLYDMYSHCASGKEFPHIVFRLADATCESFSKSTRQS